MPEYYESHDIRPIPVESDKRRFLADRVFSFSRRLLEVLLLTRFFGGSLNAFYPEVHWLSLYLCSFLNKKG